VQKVGAYFSTIIVCVTRDAADMCSVFVRAKNTVLLVCNALADPDQAFGREVK